MSVLSIIGNRDSDDCMRPNISPPAAEWLELCATLKALVPPSRLSAEPADQEEVGADTADEIAVAASVRNIRNDSTCRKC
jgi:hypothetical protein